MGALMGEICGPGKGVGISGDLRASHFKPHRNVESFFVELYPHDVFLYLKLFALNSIEAFIYL